MVKFHSVIIQVQFKVHERWVDVVAIADTGSGPSLIANQEVVDGFGDDDVYPSSTRLLGADGSPLADIIGCTEKATFRFKGGSAKCLHSLLTLKGGHVHTKLRNLPSYR